MSTHVTLSYARAVAAASAGCHSGAPIDLFDRLPHTGALSTVQMVTDSQTSSGMLWWNEKSGSMQHSTLRTKPPANFVDNNL